MIRTQRFIGTDTESFITMTQSMTELKELGVLGRIFEEMLVHKRVSGEDPLGAAYSFEVGSVWTVRHITWKNNEFGYSLIRKLIIREQYVVPLLPFHECAVPNTEGYQTLLNCIREGRVLFALPEDAVVNHAEQDANATWYPEEKSRDIHSSEVRGFKVVQMHHSFSDQNPDSKDHVTHIVIQAVGDENSNRYFTTINGLNAWLESQGQRK
jgi:hypothetical protein